MSIIVFLCLVAVGAVLVYVALELSRQRRERRSEHKQHRVPPTTGEEVSHLTPAPVVSAPARQAPAAPPPAPSSAVPSPPRHAEMLAEAAVKAEPPKLPVPSLPRPMTIEPSVAAAAEPRDHQVEAKSSNSVAVVRELPPLAFHEMGTASPRARVAAPEPPILFDPNHYRRHAGVPGYIYMARNPFHEEGLHKIGYTTSTPEARVALLNAEHQLTPDVGLFQLMHSVRVPAAYDAEQVLFDLLLSDRPVAKREFFLQSEDLLKRAIDAIQSFTTGDPASLDDFEIWRLGASEVARRARPGHVEVLPVTSPSGGWIYAVQCEWHRSDVFRISYTSKDPRRALAELDARQKRLTCRIGFHTLVHCLAVNDLRASWSAVSARLERWRVKSSKVFFEIPFEQLAQEIRAAAMPTSMAAPPVLRPVVHQEVTGEVSVVAVSGNIAASWAPWAKSCLACDAILRFIGSVGARDAVQCPCCGVEMDCTVGSRGAIVRPLDRAD